jgi:hypothetical protein
VSLKQSLSEGDAQYVSACLNHVDRFLGGQSRDVVLAAVDFVGRKVGKTRPSKADVLQKL